MVRLELVAPLSLALIVVACGPSSPSPSDGETSSEDETTGSTSGDGDPTSGDGDGDPTSGDGDGDPGDGDGDPEPLICPEPEDVSVSWYVVPPIPRAGTCTLLDHWGEDTYQQLDLDCEGDPISVTLDASLAAWMHPDTELTLDYRTNDTALGTERWLAIHNADPNGPMALALGAIDATQLDPPGSTLAEFFGVPVLSVSEEQPCPTTPDESCGDLRRLGLDVTHELGMDGPVYDRGSWYADFLSHGYQLDVAQAWRREGDCEDQLPSLFELSVTWFPSD